MTTLLLDETVFEDFCAGYGGAKQLLDRIMDGSVSAYVSPLTIVNLWRNGYLNRKSEIAYRSILTFTEEIQLNLDMAIAAGRAMVSVVLDEEQQKLDYFGLISSIASQCGYTICTRRPDKFSIFDCDVLTY